MKMLRSAILITSAKRIYIPGLSSQYLQKSKEEQLADIWTNVLASEKKNRQVNRHEILAIFLSLKNKNNTSG